MDANMLCPCCDACVYWSTIYGECLYEDPCPYCPENNKEDD